MRWWPTPWRAQSKESLRLLLVGGAHDAFTAVRPILQQLAGRVLYVGPSGSGALMMLATSLALSSQWAAFCEGADPGRAWRHPPRAGRGGAGGVGIASGGGPRRDGGGATRDALVRHRRDATGPAAGVGARPRARGAAATDRHDRPASHHLPRPRPRPPRPGRAVPRPGLIERACAQAARMTRRPHAAHGTKTRDRYR